MQVELARRSMGPTQEDELAIGLDGQWFSWPKPWEPLRAVAPPDTDQWHVVPITNGWEPYVGQNLIYRHEGRDLEGFRLESLVRPSASEDESWVLIIGGGVLGERPGDEVVLYDQCWALHRGGDHCELFSIMIDLESERRVWVRNAQRPPLPGIESDDVPAWLREPLADIAQALQDRRSSDLDEAELYGGDDLDDADAVVELPINWVEFPDDHGTSSFITTIVDTDADQVIRWVGECPDDDALDATVFEDAGMQSAGRQLDLWDEMESSGARRIEVTSGLKLVKGALLVAGESYEYCAEPTINPVADAMMRQKLEQPTGSRRWDPGALVRASDAEWLATVAPGRRPARTWHRVREDGRVEHLAVHGPIPQFPDYTVATYWLGAGDEIRKLWWSDDRRIHCARSLMFHSWMYPEVPVPELVHRIGDDLF